MHTYFYTERNEKGREWESLRSVHPLPFWWEGVMLKFLPSSQKGGKEGGEVVWHDLQFSRKVAGKEGDDLFPEKLQFLHNK